MTPTPDIVSERLMQNQLTDYLVQKKNTVTSSIRVPPKTHSTKDGLLYVNEWIRYNITNNLYTAYAALGLSKTFDSISHTIMSGKQEQIGFSMNPFSFIEDFLTNRIQRVCVNETKSEGFHVKQGVPQGTILGPLLSLL